ncbi:MAG: Spy/CpxP family protein refolding chaperone [Syntrophobacterales bacterium]|jgi:Spy/CpxP family protein refolding chaperone
MRHKLRKNLKTILLLTLVVGLVGSTSAFAFKGGGPWGRSWGRHGFFMNLTPEQAGQIFDLRQKFMNDTAELRKNMMIKCAELAQLWKAEKPDEKAIMAKVKELSALRTQFMQKAVAKRLAMRKIVPQAWGPFPGFGPGMGHGFGPGMGPGFVPGGPGGKGLGKGPGPGAAFIPSGYGAGSMPDLVLNLE